MDKLNTRQEQASPVSSAERIDFVDILRGFAVLGILIVNMFGFSGAQSGAFNLGWPGLLDRLVILLSEFFIRAKFYSLFSFLFGWGMALQFSRARSKGIRFLPVYLRRLFVLMLIGLIHGMFIWEGDILASYALFGLLLLLFRNRSQKTLLVTTGLMLLLAVALTLPWPAVTTFRDWYGQLIARINLAPGLANVYATGTYWEITLQRSHDFLRVLASLLYYGGNVFAMFLLGLYVGQRNIFRNVAAHQSLLRRVLVAGLAVGVLLNGLFVAAQLWSIGSWPSWLPAEYQQTIRTGARTIGAPALTLFYMAAIILLTRKQRWHERLAPLGSVGRMALTNYLLHSVILTAIFYGYGLGLYGQIGPTMGLVISILLFSGQVQFSRWWLERYRYGPAEWLWRSLTYGRWQPLRRGSIWLVDEQRDTVVDASRLHHRRWSKGWIASLVLTGLMLVGLVFAALSLLQVGGGGDGGVAVSLGLAGERPQPTPIVPPEFGESGQQGETSEVTIDPPQTRVTVYRPGPLAASGDLLALAETFDGQVAMDVIEALTGPLMAGRLAGSPGGWQAGQYIADQFAAYGLQPAGDDGTFFQAFEVDIVSLAGAQLTVSGSDGVVRDGYRLNEDFKVLAGGYTGGGIGEGAVIWMNACRPDDFAGQNVFMKVVLCRSDEPFAAGRYALEHGAAGLLLLTDPVTWSAAAPWPLDVGQVHRSLWIPESLALPAFVISPAVARDLLAGSGSRVADLTISFEPLSLRTTARLEVSVADPPRCDGQPCQARNVLGVLPGRDPDYTDEVVIVSGHYDHLGRSPDGTIWPGANGNASGIGVMLAIARAWQEQGFVPRRTVLFAAWDAGEVDRQGSAHYAAFPRYPLGETVAVLVLEQLGAGSTALVVDGVNGDWNPVAAVAASRGITLTEVNSGIHDHWPFQDVGVPAQLISWADEGAGQISMHGRPLDTLAAIEPDRLQTAGEVVGLTLLGMAEGTPAIDELAAERAAAVERGDLRALWQTSTAERRELDRHWFESVQQLGLLKFTIETGPMAVVGHQASGPVTLVFHFPDPAGQIRDDGQLISRTLTLKYEAQFQFESSGWRWSGAHLLPAVNHGAVQVFGPPDGLDDLSGLDSAIEDTYQALAQLLEVPESSLPSDDGITVRVYPNRDALRADVDVNLTGPAFVGPGDVRIIYSPGLTESLDFRYSIAQLLLAEAGVTREGAPELWAGLGLVADAAAGFGENGDRLVATSAAYLTNLAQAMAKDEQALTAETSAWASTDYLRRQLDWTGLGQFIANVGQACQGQCTDTQALENALQSHLGLTKAGFDAAWQRDWTGRLTAAQEAMDALLAGRASAVMAADIERFLVNVDPAASHLLAEEEHWFDGLSDHVVQTFNLSGRPLAIGDDGRVLALVTMNFDLDGPTGRELSGTQQMEVLLTPGDGGLRWAGAPLERMRGLAVEVFYPAGQRELAEGILLDAETLVSQLQRELGLGPTPVLTSTAGLTPSGELTATAVLTDDLSLTGTTILTSTVELDDTSLPPAAVTIKVYGRDVDYRYSIGLTMPKEDWLTGWTAAGESIKLGPQADRAALAVQLTRQLLHQAGVETEWLRKGVPVFVARALGIPELQYSSAGQLGRLISDAGRGNLPSLADLPGDEELDEVEWQKATTQAWDSLEYLNRNYGFEAVLTLLARQGAGQTLDEALTAVSNQSLAEFEEGWLASLRRAHLQDEWLPLTTAVNETVLAVHVAELTTDEMAGRATGSPGADLAAEYIAAQFAAYGLQPAGPDGTYLQPFPVYYTSLETAPSLVLNFGVEERFESFMYRQDFLLPTETILAGGQASGPLVLVNDGRYEGMDLRGKIVVRRPAAGLLVEIEAARSHGAVGLILLTDLAYEGDFATKSAFPLSDTQVLTMPVVYLTQPGYERLLLATGHTPVSLESGPPALSLELVAELNVPLRQMVAVESANVVGFLPGSDPLLRHEVIIVGAHYDHVGDDPDLWQCDGRPVLDPEAADLSGCQLLPGLRYPGINDNATGVAALLEIARLWQEAGYRPGRTVLFVAWAGQEAGQIGSQYYVNNPLLPLETTVGMMQLDALGAGEGRRLFGIGEWPKDGRWLFPMDTIEPFVDGRLRVAPITAQATSTLPFGRPARIDMGSDDMTFRELGLPAIRLMWQDADETNLPDALLDEINLAYVRTAVQAALLILMINAG
jgi:uncharacterized protein